MQEIAVTKEDLKMLVSDGLVRSFDEIEDGVKFQIETDTGIVLVVCPTLKNEILLEDGRVEIPESLSDTDRKIYSITEMRRILVTWSQVRKTSREIENQRALERLNGGQKVISKMDAFLSELLDIPDDIFLRVIINFNKKIGEIYDNRKHRSGSSGTTSGTASGTTTAQPDPDTQPGTVTQPTTQPTTQSGTAGTEPAEPSPKSGAGQNRSREVPGNQGTGQPVSTS